MRVLVGSAVLVGAMLGATVSADEAKKGPYDRVASGRAPHKEVVRVYTNADLKKIAKVVAEDAKDAKDDEATQEESAAAAPKAPDPLTWMRKRQDAQREQAKSVAQAQSVLTAAQQHLTDLERQVLAARNPFSARPKLSDEEKAERRDSGESASVRFERTQEQVEKAREAVRIAESELARLKAARP